MPLNTAEGGEETPLQAGAAGGETSSEPGSHLTDRNGSVDIEAVNTPRQTAWVLPAIAVLMVLGWTAFFVWTNRAAMMAPATPQEWIGWISTWAMPVVLVVALWLLAMRHSAREARRFGDAALALAAEADALEQRLASINRELSLAREFMTAQSRDLEALGRIASERLSQNAAQLQSLIHDNGAQVHAIGEVSDRALANMDRLRDQLPVIANAARDVANQIGHAGHTAQERLDLMVAAFERLNQFGEASQEQIGILRDKVAQAFSQFESQLNVLQAAGEAFARALSDGQEDAERRWYDAVERLKSSLAEAISQISQLDEAAINNARARLETLSRAGQEVDRSIIASMEAFAAEIERRRSQFAAEQEEALCAMQARLENFDSEMAQRKADHIAHMADLASRGETLSQRLAAIDADISRLYGKGRKESEALASSAQAIAERLAECRRIMEESDSLVAHLTDASVRLLELIRAGSEHSTVDLAAAIGKAEQQLAAFEQRTTALGTTINAAEEVGASLASHIGKAADSSDAVLHTLERLREGLTDVAEQSAALASSTMAELQAAITALEQATQEAVGRLGENQAETVRQIARQIGTQAGATIRQTLAEDTRDAIAHLENASRLAAEKGKQAVSYLRDQLAKVNQLTGNLESRVAQARAKAEERVDADFSRRMALITESLNSASIDIARALSEDVSDTAWASYLRGDRGIFTRRAVRLLDNGEARAVSEVYDSDPQVREAINRYIHDFEAMLRTILSTRDGNALAVTMLSSDIGKLYVALAQAIERLRD